ncbi:MAG: epoxyqueuosine reductase [Anaerolineae bacterium]
MANNRSQEQRDWITGIIQEICAGPENAMHGALKEPAWDIPLVGLARGDDPLFVEYKMHVGPEHWTPVEAMALAYPDVAIQGAELAIISWVLPQTAATRADSRASTVYPPERWARSRMFGEAFNNSLKAQVVQTLREAGYRAMSPTLEPSFGTVDSTRFVFSSNWSERHIAHACGLGTFGLCDGLITPVGKAMRLGSAIVQLPVDPAVRPYTDHHAYCLHYARGTCGVCIQRCPVGALSEGGHDKRLCRAHLDATRPIVRERYGFDGYACGLCQTGTPCEAGIPEELR